MAFNYTDQDIIASLTIGVKDVDPFYNPETNGLTGYAYDGNYYLNGVIQPLVSKATWATEAAGEFRGDGDLFPVNVLILLTKTSLIILDQSTPTSNVGNIPMWMIFLLADNYALANNFSGGLNGWTPSGVSYANGKLAVNYKPDSGNETDTSPLCVTIDFTTDGVFLDVAV